MKVANSIEDLRQEARRRVPRAIFEYADRGAYDEVTFRRNLADLAALELRQRVMIDVSQQQLSTTVLGERWRVLQPNDEPTSEDQLAVGPSGRGAGIWLLSDDADDRARLGAEVSAHLEHDVDGVDLLAWITPEADERGRWAAVSGSGIELRFRPGEALRYA